MDAKDTSIEVDIRQFRCQVLPECRQHSIRRRAGGSTHKTQHTTCRRWGTVIAFLEVIDQLCGRAEDHYQVYREHGRQTYQESFSYLVDDYDVLTSCDGSRRTWNSDDTSLNTLQLYS